ncbi:helix-turn-helix domain-containing protein [Cryobacterium psychrophilum]|uniref:XRE family transcriptional regulator n=1 Tax=Cryobacterium psychrophilum TaxID=41988 RepID=A0A4Y8KR52_9MICO|nr:helix-turn-helix transcriptional regulator [Cryobacterium psychrophilum]TFD80532.1 XRE family transcriptional regulator [Cryobacterium psychrophilum]
MQFNETPIENRFGETVLEERRIQHISQKVLAGVLSDRGFSLDASAISRIEKGTRAIRLSEAAIIADVLGFSLADVENPRDPKDDFARHRESFDAALTETYDAAMKVASIIWDMDGLLDRHPDLLKPVEPWNEPGPTGITQYVEKIGADWLERRSIIKTIGLDFEEPGLRDAVLSVISNVVSTVVGAEEHVEHKEAP